jgi:hypothetical protein
MVPLPADFHHPSIVHGQRHVGRVMVHAFRLLEATGQHAETHRLWASVFLHDLARTHDGRCYVHGANAVVRFQARAELQARFADAGIVESDLPAIFTAVTHHSQPQELARDHEHWTLTSLLKDADGLDRVRLGDLDTKFLRWPESREMTAFAQRLYDASGSLPEGPQFFSLLMEQARTLG